MSMNYKVSSPRGPNNISANPERIESEDGTRWATGRNVKVSTGYRTYGAVRVWALKTRDAAGKAVTVETHRDRDAAMAWCGLTGAA